MMILDYFKKFYKNNNSQLIVAGDSKNTIVFFERAKESSFKVALNHLLKTAAVQPCMRFVVGSAWEADAKLVLKTWSQLKKKSNIDSWQLVLVPHKLDHRTILAMMKLAEQESLQCILFSCLPTYSNFKPAVRSSCTPC